MEVKAEIMEAAEVRTPEIIAVEIKTTLNTVGMIALQGVIKVGECLTEAKELVGHGGWLDYLEKTVGFSERSAQRYMKIYQEYGVDSNPTIVSDLSYTNALRLLQLPEEDKKELLSDIESGEVAPEDVSAEIEKYKARIEELENEAEDTDNVISAKEDLIDELKSQIKEIEAKTESGGFVSPGLTEEWKQEAQELRAKLAESEQKLKDAKAAADVVAQKKIDKAVADTKKELEEKAATASTEELDKLKADLAAAKSRAAEAEKKRALSSSTSLAEMSITLRSLVSDGDAAIKLIEAADPETQPKWRAATLKALSDIADKVGGTAGAEPPAANQSI